MVWPFADEMDPVAPQGVRGILSVVEPRGLFDKRPCPDVGVQQEA